MTAARYNQGKPQLGYLLQFPVALRSFCCQKLEYPLSEALHWSLVNTSYFIHRPGDCLGADPDLSSIFEYPIFMEAFCRVKELGAVKYERDNWKKGGKPDWEYLDAYMRHLLAYANGEIFAQDTGCHHLAHSIWNLWALVDLNYSDFWCSPEIGLASRYLASIIEVSHDSELFQEMLDYWSK